MTKFGPARSIPVVSDVDHGTLVGVAYASEDGDIVITINSKDFKEEVGAFYSVEGTMQFMIGCQYKPAEQYSELSTTSMRIRNYFVEFSHRPRVLVNAPDNKNDGRVGRVTEINEDATIRVCFESGPGDVVATLQRWELVSVGESAVKFPKPKER